MSARHDESKILPRNVICMLFEGDLEEVWPFLFDVHLARTPVGVALCISLFTPYHVDVF